MPCYPKEAQQSHLDVRIKLITHKALTK